MTTNSFNICPTCAHVNYCVLTEMKEKVWSCSDYDEAQTGTTIIQAIEPVRQLELV